MFTPQVLSWEWRSCMCLVPVPCWWINSILPSKCALYPYEWRSSFHSCLRKSCLSCSSGSLRRMLVCLTSFSQAPKDPLAILGRWAAVALVNGIRAREQAVLPAGELIQQNHSWPPQMLKLYSHICSALPAASSHSVGAWRAVGDWYISSAEDAIKNVQRIATVPFTIMLSPPLCICPSSMAAQKGKKQTKETQLVLQLHASLWCI